LLEGNSLSSPVQLAPPTMESSRLTGPEPVPVATPRKDKKEILPALTGLRCFAALNIVFFHFSNPKWFGPFAPIVDNGFTSVSFFLMLSGFVLAYNYSDRAQQDR